MKIIQVIDSIDMSGGGPSRSVPTMSIGLKERGVECEFLCYKSPKPNDVNLNKNGIKINYKERESTLIDRLLCRNFVFEGNNENLVFHLQQFWLPCIHKIARYCYSKGIPYIISPRGTLEPWSLQQKKYKKKVALCLYQKNDMNKAACIHATSIEEYQHIRDMGVKSPVAIIPNGILVKNYPLSDYKSQDKFNLLFLSRIHPKKGIEILLKALSLLPLDLLKRINLSIVGEGDDEYGINDLKELVNSKYSDLPIKIIGPKYGKDKIDCYHKSDLFILPTYSENFGMVIAEAMCCGVPVITTTGTPWNVLKEKKLGWWVEPHVENIKDSIIEALNLNHEELRKKGLASREEIISNYSMEVVSTMFKDLYSWIYDKNQPMPYFVHLD